MDLKEAQSTPRESMDYDVVIVGAGPAGLAAAIRLKQLDEAISVVVVEKGSEVGAHILSGAVIDPIGLDRLLPDWRQDEARPLHTQVSEDVFYFLGPAGGARLPNFAMPKLMGNHGNFVGSLGLVTRYLAARAEALGVEIYPGFAAAELLFNADGSVAGIATGDMGIARDGTVSDRFTRGMELRGRYTLLGEGPAARSPRSRSGASRSTRGASRRNSASGSRRSGRSSRRSSARGWSSTPSAGRSTAPPAAAPSSTISTTTWSRSASSSTSTTRIRRSRPSTSSSASRRIR